GSPGSTPVSPLASKPSLTGGGGSLLTGNPASSGGGLTKGSSVGPVGTTATATKPSPLSSVGTPAKPAPMKSPFDQSSGKTSVKPASPEEPAVSVPSLNLPPRPDRSQGGAEDLGASFAGVRQK